MDVRLATFLWEHSRSCWILCYLSTCTKDVFWATLAAAINCVPPMLHGFRAAPRLGSLSVFTRSVSLLTLRAETYKLPNAWHGVVGLVMLYCRAGKVQ